MSETGRTPSRCPWAQRDNDDSLYLCEKPADHDGDHACTFEWDDNTPGAFVQGYKIAPARTPS